MMKHQRIDNPGSFRPEPCRPPAAQSETVRTGAGTTADAIISRMAEERLPRYTSYPTAPAFGSGNGPEAWAADHADWLAALPIDRPVSLYLHVPYCRSMCRYCGCTTKITRRDDPIDAYAAVLQREIDLVADRMPDAMKAGHIHWGGGTPGILGTERMKAIRRRLADRFTLDPAAECAIELDPRHMASVPPRDLAAMGVNRVSFGIQTLDARVQAAIGRIQPFEQVAAAVASVRDVGIRRISFDLIYGLPYQTVESAAQTVWTLLALSPDRISIFGYAHIPWAKPHQRLIPDETLPDAHDRAAQFTAMADVLADAGYVAIGIDHFARPDDSMAIAHRDGTLRRNFQGYTTDPCDTILGFGASAISTLRQGYTGNDTSIAAYSRSIHDGRLATNRGYELTREDRLRGDAINALMCTSSVSIDDVARRHPGLRDQIQRIFDDAASSLEHLGNAGLVEWDGNRLSIAREARLLVRSVAAAFDEYLAKTGEKYSKAI
ncbi:oxygen-independent coproporphyrinogen III oxidase [Fodinicurvata sp. EGI_FJ10296]|uniref:oxygen-independent coproporphyrinogen III oxidase n=1 Tax=Fodinicurvata sp. EGI_FJ10296 TaxID=3231908 RepID=UPI0034536BFF